MENFENVHIILYCITAVLTYFSLTKYLKRYSSGLITLIGILFILNFGLRNHNIGTDTKSYISAFENISDQNFVAGDFKDLGFYYSMKALSSVTTDKTVYLTTLACLFLIPLIWFFRKIPAKYRVLLFFSFLSFFFFKNLGINLLRQGISISFFLCALYLWLNKKYIPSVILFVVAFSFHASIILPFLIALISIKLKKVVLATFLFLISSISSFLGYFPISFIKNIPILNKIFQDRYEQDYLFKYHEYLVGFRLDFFIFNTIFALLGFFIFFSLRRRKQENFKLAKLEIVTIINFYLISSSVFFLSFSNAFSDRFGIYSWISIPFILYSIAEFKLLSQSKLIVYFVSIILFITFYNI